MCRNVPTLRKRQDGFGMPMVVFILVIMTLLATAMVQLSSTAAISIGHEIQSNRAFYAAESGAQWAMNQLFPPTGGGGACFIPNPTVLNFTQGGLNGCSASIQCQSPGAFNGSTHFLITSTGSCGDQTRQIQVGAKQ